MALSKTKDMPISEVAEHIYEEQKALFVHGLAIRIQKIFTVRFFEILTQGNKLIWNMR